MRRRTTFEKNWRPDGWKIKYREELDSSVDLGAKGNLAQRLQSQYVLSKVSGNDITPGTVLTLRKPGLTGCSKFALTNNYKDSRLKQSFGSGLAAAMMGSDNSPTRSFDVGEALYLVRISVKDNSVDFVVITREIYDGAHYAASVSLQFSKGYLASADPAKVQETIAELFKVDEGQDVAGANTEGNEAAPQPIAAPAAPPEQPQQAAQPQSIELGQTTEQVVATLGQPSKIVKLGDKQIYVYKDLKVTFINGKVSNVE